MHIPPEVLAALREQMRPTTRGYPVTHVIDDWHADGLHGRVRIRTDAQFAGEVDESAPISQPPRHLTRWSNPTGAACANTRLFDVKSNIGAVGKGPKPPRLVRTCYP